MTNNPTAMAIAEADLMNQSMTFHRMATVTGAYARAASNIGNLCAGFRVQYPERAEKSPFLYFIGNFHPSFAENLQTLATGLMAQQPESDFNHLFAELFTGERNIGMILRTIDGKKGELLKAERISEELADLLNFQPELDSEHATRQKEGTGCGLNADGSLTNNPCSGAATGNCTALKIIAAKEPELKLQLKTG